MGMVFQAYSLFPNMTAEKNVEYGLRIRKQPRGQRQKRVAELSGTMNRLEASVVDSSTGVVDHGGTLLTVEAARGRKQGERVLVLVRPEVLELAPAEDGAANGANHLAGEVISHTFLGPVTRLKVIGPAADL